MSDERETPDDEKHESDAAQQEEGQDQDPVQADPERSSTVWDTDQHSDAPGPFGTGDAKDPDESD